MEENTATASSTGNISKRMILSAAKASKSPQKHIKKLEQREGPTSEQSMVE
jgi:hypothetical protein